MWFTVYDPEGDVLYEGSRWPMARAALDCAIMKDNGCPLLTISPLSDS